MSNSKNQFAIQTAQAFHPRCLATLPLNIQEIVALFENSEAA